MAIISGEANETGFKIEIGDANFSIKRSTANYKEQNEDDLIMSLLFRQ